MNKIILIISIMSSSAFAWKTGPQATKEQVFNFKYKGESLQVVRNTASYEEAFEEAAQECFKHFKGAKKVSMDTGLDIIDVCANPR